MRKIVTSILFSIFISSALGCGHAKQAIKVDPPVIAEPAKIQKVEKAPVPVVETVKPVEQAKHEKPAKKKPFLDTRLPPGKRIIYLTFDDGPSARTLTIAEYLAREHVKATFFVVGQYLKGHESIVSRTLALGHAVGNHTYTHNRRLLLASFRKKKNEIEITKAMVDKLGGNGNLVRIPYGSFKFLNRIPASVKSRYSIIDWDIDSKDSLSAQNSSEKIIRNVLNGLRTTKKNEIIILFHDRQERFTTVKAIKALIPILKKQGYVMMTMSADSNVRWANRRFLVKG